MKYFCTYPYEKNDNPFLKIVMHHLQKSGWSQKNVKFRTFQMIKHRKDVSLFWFHWPNSVWRDKNFILKFISVSRFMYHVYLANFLGYKLVWSVHNVMPHGEQNSKLEFLMRKFIAANFSLFVGHAKNTFKMLEKKKIVGKKYVLAVHGHYEEEYQDMNKEISRKAMGLADDEIIILIKSGGKNYESALKFSKVFDSLELKNIKLLVLGNKVSNNERVLFVSGFIPKEDLSSYIELSDFVALPYDDITTSGAYFLAITFGKPVIAKKLPFFLEHGGSETCLLFDNYEELKAIFISLEKNEVYFDKQKVLFFKDKFSWKESCENISNAFNNLLLN